MRQLRLTILGLALLLGSCLGVGKSNKIEDAKAEDTTNEKVTMAKLYDYRVVAEYPHSTESYTQGLQYHNGIMWEGTGQEGESHLLQTDLNTGKRTILASLSKEEFGEGITIYGERIYQLTWTSGNAYVYDLDGNLLERKHYNGEGWGLTTDGKSLYLSDGSSTIRRIDPETLHIEESICVTLDGQPLDMINELEWVDGKIWANIYCTYAVVEIDPKSGAVIGYIDIPELHARLKDNPEAEVLNGVAYNAENGYFYLTGKDWNRIFEVEIVK